MHQVMARRQSCRWTGASKAKPGVMPHRLSAAHKTLLALCVASMVLPVATHLERLTKPSWRRCAALPYDLYCLRPHA